MKKTTLLIISLIIFASFYLILATNKQPEPPNTIPSPTVIPADPQILNRVNIQGIPMNNFLETSKTIEETGEVFAVEETDYVIIYHKTSDDFLINILSSPFEDIRIKAERDFLQKLGITEENACKLDVVEKTPHFANPDKAGQSFRLSFCE